MQHLGHRAFQRFDPHRSGHVGPELLEKDLTRITNAAAKTRRYVNRHVAHLSTTPAAEAPSFAELDEAFDVLSEIFIKWNTVLTGIDLLNLEPVPQYDWLAPLRVPWIVDLSRNAIARRLHAAIPTRKRRAAPDVLPAR